MRKLLTNKLVLGGLVLALALAGWLFLTERPLKVPLVQAQDNVALRIYGLGTVEARILSRVGFEVGAALTDLTVDAGDRVAKGQPLARLSPTEQQARVARSKAAVDASQAALAKAEAAVERAAAVLAQREAANRRQVELAKSSTISSQAAEESARDVAVAQADLRVAAAEVAVSRAQSGDAAAALLLEETLLAHHTLLAPYDALVVSRQAEAGMVVKAGEPIFTLIDPATIWVLAFIDEERAGLLALGQGAEIRLRSLPHQVFTGSVARIGLESDRVNEERKVWLTCTDCPPQMFLGEQAEVRITTATRARALMVPEIAISGFDGHQGSVWTLQGGKLVRATLIFGARDEAGRVELAEGLPEGAQIVAAPVKGAAEGRLARAESPAP
ncbi:efflux RND transporter periplasmic adaptor subunit [Rhodobacter ferrooxidans]|uniref:Efflux transporter, RND family, MFP subunit n=1 Tax=Rhodobacter ferrooxidans TaxID=371731 RepID=C8S5G2_9RHOB|nr:efflux RND transporter periplasmic adaptor subunit [Rhodobacter sp. SW2]EEW23775.1 efflux transporter, RND family, MFP subunit [Rhodobacter sp. SW2]